MILLSVIAFTGCNKCDDCAPGQNYPFVNVRFYNIDSLVKVENSIAGLNDSIQIINDLITGGNTEWNSVLAILNNKLLSLESAKQKISQGKIRVEKVTAEGTDNNLFFRDSTTHDTLTSFKFPLSLETENSEFFITLPGRIDTLGLKYQLETESYGSGITRRAYNLSVIKNTYDSLKFICKYDSCVSDETTISIYF